MPITNKVKFETQEKTTVGLTNSSDWVFQGTMLDASKQTAGNDYLTICWVNAISPGSNAGATKFAMEDGGGDLLGSNQQRHDTNSSGMHISHIGEFTAADPPQNIGVYRKRITGSNNEGTHYGQAFVIDLSYSGTSGGLENAVDYVKSTDVTERTRSPGGTWHTQIVSHSGDYLILAAAKVYDSVDTVLVGLDVEGTVVSSGSRFTQNAADMKTITFSVAQN